MPIEDYPVALAGLRESHREFHMTLSGLEVALFRAALASGGKSELAHWGGRLRRLETDITIPFTPGGGVSGPVARPRRGQGVQDVQGQGQR